eukprot:TRINITY_DN56773_c0_g1_i1.p1 TRINITY_DN56773_c0_g1~~TRINITY_DN56773_c0_g1_i1.p1  ORF type:complete len:340 (+),score=33.99 TRINITY_DN56773_c0_g1_i1:3-1022(+)
MRQIPWHFVVAVGIIQSCEVSARYVLIELGADDGSWSKLFMTYQKDHFGIEFTPVLVEVKEERREVLTQFAADWGGHAIIAAAWVSTGVQTLHRPRFRGNVGSSLINDGVYGHTSGSVTVDVPSVSVAEIIEQYTTLGDHVVMRLDVEGAEYEILRDLLLRGLVCRLEKVFLEVHAMYSPTLHGMRSLDASLPWLLEPCVEVIVEQNYFLDTVVAKNWPADDHGCSDCPLLYRPLSGPSCPTTALALCFEPPFTCERCCDLSKGLRGDLQCWHEEYQYKLCCAGIIPENYKGKLTYNPDEFISVQPKYFKLRERDDYANLKYLFAKDRSSALSLARLHG